LEEFSKLTTEMGMSSYPSIEVVWSRFNAGVVEEIIEYVTDFMFSNNC
jgi:hypothetical protein